jgi:hypothetical protein
MRAIHGRDEGTMSECKACDDSCVGMCLEHAMIAQGLGEPDKEELRKFERYLHVKSETEKSAEDAYADVYGEVVFESKDEG